MDQFSFSPISEVYPIWRAAYRLANLVAESHHGVSFSQVAGVGGDRIYSA